VLVELGEPSIRKLIGAARRVPAEPIKRHHVGCLLAGFLETSRESSKKSLGEEMTMRIVHVSGVGRGP
jgi:hypothetical protein